MASVPALQLFIAGANYDMRSQTWVTNSNSFDLYVVSANQAKTDVIVSLALGAFDNPNSSSVTFGENQIDPSDWSYGYAPLDNQPEILDPGDLQHRTIYPTWFTEINTGNYGLGSQVGDAIPRSNFWNPATGEGPTEANGEVKRFHVELGGGFSSLHFDAYTLRPDGSIYKFAPFSHDAQASVVPEPGTLALLGTGLFGLAAFTRRRKNS